MFTSEAMARQSEAPFKCSTLGYAPDLTHKQKTRLEKPARDKQSSLFEIYGHKKFYNIGPCTLGSNIGGGRFSHLFYFLKVVYKNDVAFRLG
jgi:hypothetical protein